MHDNCYMDYNVDLVNFNAPARIMMGSMVLSKCSQILILIKSIDGHRKAWHGFSRHGIQDPYEDFPFRNPLGTRGEFLNISSQISESHSKWKLHGNVFCFLPFIP